MLDTTQHSTSIERTKESVRTLKRLFSVVAGLALSQGILTIVSTREPVVTIDYASIPWFIAFLATLIPFHHGALRYVDDTYIFAEQPPKSLVLLVDYAMLFVEAGILFYMALTFHSPNYFILGYVALLGLDIIWIISTYFLTSHFDKLKKWFFLNITVLIIIAIVHFTPILDDIEPQYVWVIAILRSICDYAFSWSFICRITKTKHDLYQ